MAAKNTTTTASIERGGGIRDWEKCQ